MAQCGAAYHDHERRRTCLGVRLDFGAGGEIRPPGTPGVRVRAVRHEARIYLGRAPDDSRRGWESVHGRGLRWAHAEVPSEERCRSCEDRLGPAADADGWRRKLSYWAGGQEVVSS